MSESSTEASGGSSSSTHMLVPILLLFLLLIIAVLRSPNLISPAGIGSAVIVMAPLALATYALMALAIAGRGTVDLSVGPLMGFINVTLVVLHGAGALESPITFFLYAIFVGVAYQLLMAFIIIYVRVQPIIVALSGYLALSGINLVILPRPGGVAPEWMSSWGLGTTIYSPILVILVLSTAAWLIFTSTAFYGHLRLMGSDERAAYTSGVRITIVRIGAHCISGVFSALAALTYTALIGSGDPTQGTTYTLISVTALVLGGTSLAGGRGGVIGSLLGAVNLFLIGYVLATFSFGAVQGFVTDLAYGVILVLSLLLTVAIPWIQTRIKNISPTLIFIGLSILFAGVILHAKYNYAQPSALTQEQRSSVVETTPAPDNQASQEAAQVPTQAPPIATVSTELTASPVHPAPTGFFLEGVVTSGTTATDSKLAKPIALIILLAVSLLIIARAVVLQTRQRRMSMRMVFVLVTALVLTAYLAWEYTTLPTQTVAIYDQIKEHV
jgi:ribose transport system permease protein